MARNYQMGILVFVLFGIVGSLEGVLDAFRVALPFDGGNLLVLAGFLLIVPISQFLNFVPGIVIGYKFGLTSFIPACFAALLGWSAMDFCSKQVYAAFSSFLPSQFMTSYYFDFATAIVVGCGNVVVFVVSLLAGIQLATFNRTYNKRGLEGTR